MTSTFDNKVYEILKGGGGPGPDPSPEEEEEEEEEDIPDPSPEVDFDNVYPVNSIISSRSSQCPFTEGTWKLIGLFGIGSSGNHKITFERDHAIWYSVIDAAGSTQWTINFNDYFGDCTIKSILGPSYKSPQNEQSPNTDVYNRFYDDKNGWYVVKNSDSQITVKGAGLADRTRKYELTVLIQLNNFDQTIKTFAANDISYQFLRTA